MNDHNYLWYGIFSAGSAALILRIYIFPFVGATGWALVALAFFGLFAAFLGWMSILFFRTYFRLRGHVRIIAIDERSITFPEFADSLNVIKLDFSRIHEVYIPIERRGQPGNLVIKYDQNGHAYIGRDALERSDFDEICRLFKVRLQLDEIEVRK